MLWTNVKIEPGVSEAAINASLTRSGTSPLAIAIRDGPKPFGPDSDEDPEPEFSDALLQSIVQGLSRARSLDITMHHDVFMELPWPDSVPSLEHLDMHITDIDPTESPNIHETFSRNLPALFPALKRYQADGYTFDFMHWTLPPTLTELHLFGSGPYATYGLNSVTDTLRQLPCLESLVLNNAMPYDSPQTNYSSYSSVTLPFLRYLHLAGPIDAQVVLLDILKPGPSVRLTLTLVMHENLEQTERLLSRPSFSSWTRQIVPPVNVAIAVEDWARYNNIRGDGAQSGGCEVTFMAWSTPQTLKSMEATPRKPYKPCNTLLHLTFALHDNTVILSPTSTRDLFSPLERLLSSFPLSDVDTLVLNCTDGPVFNAPRVYHKMIALRTLHIHNTIHQYSSTPQGNALQEILQLVNLAEDMGDHTVVFPQLAAVILSGIQYHNAQDSFLEALQRRKILRESKQSLSDKLQVRLLGCFSLTSSYVETLGHVAAVEWDGLVAADQFAVTTVESDSINHWI